MASSSAAVKTDCILCVWGCGINAYVEDGRLVKVEGMAGHPLSRGGLCPRGEHLVEYVYSPDRLKYPMQRENGAWKRISWDQALDTIASKLTEIKQKYGAHALATYCGSIGVENIELAAFTQRFRGAYGTPNFISVESNCFRARILARQMTFGRYIAEEPEREKSRCIILWGHNPDNSRWMVGERIREAVAKGTKLIVIDPRRIPLAKEGIHLQIRPGTDCALALAMLNVIIAEGLYDSEFVDKYTLGFDKLREHVKHYPPQKVEEITGIPAAEIKNAARIYATAKPASIIQGICSLDMQINGFQSNRILAILQAVTGNIDAPGGWVTVPFIRLSDLRLPEVEKPIGADEYPLFHTLWNRVSPYGQAMLFPEVVLTEKPYPFKALIVVGGNPANTLPDSSKVRKAFEKLELVVAIDPFMTETAELADIVLPACTFLEKSGIGYVYGVTSTLPYVLLRKRVIEPLWESWPDWKIFTELARRMGYGEYFPWNTEEEVIAHLLEPCQVSLEQLREKPEGEFYGALGYDTYQKKGFGTPSKKVEIYSETLEQYGHDPLPTHHEPTQSPISSPELAKEYPLILITGARMLPYTHSQLRNVFGLRRLAPEPLVEIHPSTARKFDITDGEMVAVETKAGSIKIKAKVTEDIMPQVVSIPHGWAQANVNILSDLDLLEPITGYPERNAVLCRVRKI
jgi:anaerobic selenocysteine-containing dehydrogenase